MTSIAPYGTWDSPVTTELLASQSISLAGALRRPEGLYWLEGRPTENGRLTIVHKPAGGEPRDLLPPPWNARSRVHEYGGGAWLIDDAGVFFVNFTDQQIYFLDASTDAEPRALTQAPSTRFADMVVDASRNRLVAVAEVHADGAPEPANSIVAIDLADGSVTPLVTGHDFYAAPRLDPTGKQLAWLAWNHPNMPWDGTTLSLAYVEPDGAISHVRVVAGDVSTSIQQPQFGPGGQLCFVSDASGWWNLYAFEHGEARPLHPLESEFGGPQWGLGLKTWDFAGPDHIVCVITDNSTDSLARLELATGHLERLETGCNSIGAISADATGLVYTGAAADSFAAVRAQNWNESTARIVRAAAEVELPPETIAQPQAVSYETGDGSTAHGFYYAPANADFAGPEGERPPLLVMTHGGPTAAASPSLSLATQYWTSRGIAVLDVNYRGSTGYGRAYRDSLKAGWGVRDVEDAAHGATYLADACLVDSARLIIRGGSAGGYTTLAALAFTDVFKAGASLYGIGDLEALARDTHKFESRYLDGLVGPYPDAKDIYVARSPIHHVACLECPTIFLQGLEDKIVPPNQAEAMVAALDQKGIPVAYVPFEGEQHGFRKAENIKRALDAELYFYGKVFGFNPADTIDPVTIKNLDRS